MENQNSKCPEDEIIDLKEKNRVMTQKFQACKKERDDLK